MAQGPRGGRREEGAVGKLWFKYQRGKARVRTSVSSSVNGDSNTYLRRSNTEPQLQRHARRSYEMPPLTLPSLILFLCQYITIKENPTPKQTTLYFPDISPKLFHSTLATPASLPFPKTCQAYSHLRAFAHAIPSAWKTFPAGHYSIGQVKRHLLREPALTILAKGASPSSHLVTLSHTLF